MARIESIRNYTPHSSDNFFFDNNVWMYIFCPIGNHDRRKQQVYSRLFEEIMHRKATIWINSLVLSEFFNASMRLDYNLWKDETIKQSVSGIPSKTDYKNDYRKTKRYANSVIMVNSVVKSIMALCEKSSDNFNSLEATTLLSSIKDLDFNDAYYILWSKSLSFPLKIVTDDRDFNTVEKITIIQD